MTVKGAYVLTLYCDGDGDDVGDGAIHGCLKTMIINGATYAETASHAKQEGWVIRLHSNEAYCPECSR